MGVIDSAGEGAPHSVNVQTKQCETFLNDYEELFPGT